MNSVNNGRDNGTGRFLPGNAGKPKGSSKNKLRDEIRLFLNDRWQEFPSWFDSLKPQQKIQALLDLMPYALSRLQSVSMTDSDGNDLAPKTTIDYTKLSESALKEILNATTINENESHQ